MLDTAFQRAQLQLIQKHNQDEEAANNERTQRRIEEWNKSAEAIEDAQQRAHEAIINQARINGASEIEIDRLTADAVSNYTIQSNRERAAKAAADEKAASDKQTAANKAAAEKRKKDSEEAYRNQVEAIRAMEDESINLNFQRLRKGDG